MIVGLGVGVGFQYGSGGAGDQYSVEGNSPDFVSDFVAEYYRANGTVAPFGDVLDHERPGNATMVDSDGLVKWAPHNYFLNSDTPVTQTIAVVDGAVYTVEVSGPGSVNLSDSASGSASDGSPLTVISNGTNVTATVVGNPTSVWFYRSDLGGMVNNPDTGNSYVSTNNEESYLPRRGHHVWDGSSWVNQGLLIESDAATNLILNSQDVSTQTVTVSADVYTLSFTGSGSVTLSGAATNEPLIGTGEQDRVSLTFTSESGPLTLTVAGDVNLGQLEQNGFPTSYIPTIGAVVTRPGETLVIAAANAPAYTDSFSIQLDGAMSYADNSTLTEVVTFEWQKNSTNFVRHQLSTTGSRDGQPLFYQRESTSGQQIVNGPVSQFLPGLRSPISLAARHGNTFVNGASSGLVFTEDVSPTILPDLSQTDIKIATRWHGPISVSRMWGEDITDAGLLEATS